MELHEWLHLSGNCITDCVRDRWVAAQRDRDTDGMEKGNALIVAVEKKTNLTVWRRQNA